ncbi:MAG: DsrE family protein [Candidatus Thermoplasmatota archaeon]|nr:DsrE family protein [Candidatus Thermoplasmatota archaeon]
MAESTLVLVTRAPYGLEDAFAGLRMALAMSVNGMTTSVVLIEDGVYNGLGSQKPEAVRMPSNAEATKELYDFDVPVYVVKEDLASRGIEESRLFEGLKVIPASEVKKLVSEHELVTTF